MGPAGDKILSVWLFEQLSVPNILYFQQIWI